MRTLDLQSERYSPTGNAAGEGIRNQLGRPSLHPLTILTRETVQNSWDARVHDGTPPTYGISMWTATAPQIRVLSDHVFSQWPESLHQPEAMTSGDSVEQLRLMAIYDRGTGGLGGPTRADRVGRGPERRDFVQFLRNVGEPPDVEFGGGTFGYGKAATYMASRARTICIHTHCLNEGQPEVRFIAAALGNQFNIEDGSSEGRYTGRHWWGVYDEDVVDPLTGPEADEMASALGLPGFAPNERGTTLLIIDPILEGTTDIQPELPFEESSERALKILKDTILWYFWPKMVTDASGSSAMKFVINWNGEDVDVPRPEDHEVVREFAAAMKELKAEERGVGQPGPLSRSYEIASLKPARDLGRLVLRRFASVAPDGNDADEEVAAPIRGHSHHVALMRRAGLIVKYHPGPAPEIGQLDYCGVFMTEDDREVDRAFADSEPPTHHDWVPDSLSERLHKTFVRVALRRIDEKLQEFASPVAEGPSGSALVAPLGAFSELMADLLPGEEGTGAGPVAVGGGVSGGAGGTRGKRAVVNVLGAARLESRDGKRVALIDFEVTHARDSAGTIIEAETSASLDAPGAGTAERDVPAGVPVPEVIEWVAPDGKSQTGARAIEVPIDVEGRWQVAVSVPPDTAVLVKLMATSKDVP